MSTTGRAWHSGFTVDQAMHNARMMYGPGYRITLLRSKPDTAMRSGVLALVRWEIIDQARADEEDERRTAPLTGLQLQALAYLAEG